MANTVGGKCSLHARGYSYNSCARILLVCDVERCPSRYFGLAEMSTRVVMLLFRPPNLLLVFHRREYLPPVQFPQLAVTVRYRLDGSISCRGGRKGQPGNWRSRCQGVQERIHIRSIARSRYVLDVCRDIDASMLIRLRHRWHS